MAKFRQTRYGMQESITDQKPRETFTGFRPSERLQPVSDSDTGTTPATGLPSYGNYEASDTVKQAEEMVRNQIANQPGGYQSAWQAQLDDILGKILNREEFSYDLNGDALYQQYKDQYMLQGQQAMMDTMGQAAAMTGGYGNSYAQTAGQQVYQGHIQQLNDRIPELYNLALSKYQMEGQNLLDRFAMIGAMEEQDYGRYRDQVADEQWQAEFDEAKRRYDQEWEQEYGSSSGGSSSGGGGGSYNADTAEIQQMLKDAGYNIDVDGIWGPQTQEAYDDYRNNGGAEEGPTEAEQPELSSAGQNFMENLPYLPGGGNPETWKNYVDERLEREFNNGTLSPTDVEIILRKLGL